MIHIEIRKKMLKFLHFILYLPNPAIFLVHWWANLLILVVDLDHFQFCNLCCEAKSILNQKLASITPQFSKIGTQIWGKKKLCFKHILQYIERVDWR